MQAPEINTVTTLQRHLETWRFLGVGPHNQRYLQGLNIEAYKTLGVHPAASAEAITKVHREFLRLAAEAEARDGGDPDAAATSQKARAIAVLDNPQTRRAYDAKISIQLLVLEWNTYRILRTIGRLQEDVARAEEEHRIRIGQLQAATDMRKFREDGFCRRLIQPPPRRDLLIYDYVNLLAFCPAGLLDLAWQDIAMLAVAHHEEIWASEAVAKAADTLSALRGSLHREEVRYASNLSLIARVREEHNPYWMAVPARANAGLTEAQEKGRAVGLLVGLQSVKPAD